MSTTARRFLSAATLSLVLLAAAGRSQILGYPVILSGPRNSALASGDLNGDGYLDLAMSDRISTVRVCFGNGLGTCVAGTPITVGTTPIAIVVEDLNGDRRLDMATANFGSNNVSVLLATGSGTFGAPVSYPTAVNPNCLAVADLNADGRRDLVTTSQSGSVSVLLGNGAGSFAAATHYPAGTTVLCLAVGDWNTDGKQDVAATTFTGGTVSLLAGNGSGGLGAATPIPINGRPDAIATTDLNRDGKADLVVSNRMFQGEVIVLLGNGAGGFSAQPPVHVGQYPADLAIADFNADGKDDVVVTCDRSAVLLGDGTGALGSPNGVSASPTASPNSLAIGDLDHDGRMDLITNEDGMFDRIWVYPGVGAAFATTARLVETQPWSVAIAEMTGNSAPDVVAANRGSNSVSVLANDGAGGFAAAQHYPVGAQPTDVALGDLDGDNRADVVTANSVANTVSVLRNNGSGALLPAVSRAAGTGPFAVAVVDVNGDGRRDVVALAATSANVLVLLGDGAGGLGTATSIGLPGGGAPSAFALADLDSDGDQDIIVTLWSTAAVALLTNNGAGSFALQSVVSLGSLPVPSGIAVGDVNRDGSLDAIVTGAGGRVALLPGDGAGGFQIASLLYVLPAQASSPVLADINSDGLVDLAVAFKDLGSVSVMLGNGAGGFGLGTVFPTVVQGQPSEIAAADLNGDGAPDLVAANTTGISNAIAVLLGQGLVPFGTGTSSCAGMLGTSGATAARIGQSRFGFTVTNAPPKATGALMVAATPDVLGTTIPSLGLTFQVSLPTLLLNLPLVTDAGGVGFRPLPIPLSSRLIGVRLFTQSLCVEQPGSGRACSGAFLNLVASRGLAMTVLP